MYRPHRAPRRAGETNRLTAWLSAGAPPRADTSAPPAHKAATTALNLVVAEFRLIGANRVFLLIAAAVAAASYFVDFRRAASLAAVLLLVFALTAHAGRSEARGLLTLTRTAPSLRRVAFVVAGAAWTTLLALPALLRAPGIEVLGLAAAPPAHSRRLSPPALLASAARGLRHGWCCWRHGTAIFRTDAAAGFCPRGRWRPPSYSSGLALANTDWLEV